MTKPKVSIVICTHRRYKLLSGAVQSLIDQTALPADYEVIVVDNDYQSNLQIQNIVLKARSKIRIKYFHESKLGLSHARNTGGKYAISDYIGYLDDDAKANPKYIATLAQVLHTYKPDICGGPYYPFYLDPKPIWFLDKYGSNGYGDVPRYLGQCEYLTGSNIVFRRGLLDELGWFNPHYGMCGNKLWYGEETKIIMDAWNKHPLLGVYYDPDLYVYHLVPVRKMSLLYKIKMSYNYGRSQVYFWYPESEYSNIRSNAFKELLRVILKIIIKSIPDIIFRDHKNYPYWQNYFYEKTSKHFSVVGRQVRLIQDLIVDNWK